MTGYVRQSATDILDGEIVEAGPINAELDAIVDAFDETSGHAHDGSTQGGPKLALTVSVSGILPVANGGTNSAFTGAVSGDNVIVSSSTALTYRKNNFAATAAPAATDDSGDSYSVGSMWLNVTSGLLYMATSVSLNAAVWVNVTDPAAIAAVFGKVRVTSVDTTADELNDKITVSGNITKSTVNPGANETLNFDVPAVSAASTIAAGIVELATDAETIALADTSRAITPSNLAAFAAINQGAAALRASVLSI
jgi:hypothetical protein